MKRRRSKGFFEICPMVLEVYKGKASIYGARYKKYNAGKPRSYPPWLKKKMQQTEVVEDILKSRLS